MLVFVLPPFFISFIFVLVRLHYSVGFFVHIIYSCCCCCFFVSRSCSCLYSSFFYHVLFCLTSVHICVYLFGFLTNMFLLLPAIVAHIKFNCVDLDTPSLKRHWRLNRTISLTEQPLRGGCTFYDQTKKKDFISFSLRCKRKTHFDYSQEEKKTFVLVFRQT